MADQIKLNEIIFLWKHYGRFYGVRDGHYDGQNELEHKSKSNRGPSLDCSENCSLYNNLHENEHRQFSDVQLLGWAQQLVLGLKALHDLKIIHGNLSTRNLYLLDNCKVLKIYLDVKQPKEGPISAYTAPEILKYKPATENSDVYSLGIILWELLSRKKPFNFDTKNRRFPSMILDGQRPNLDEIKQFNEVIRFAIEQCWNEDPSKRPSLIDLILVFKYDYINAEKLKPIASSLI